MCYSCHFFFVGLLLRYGYFVLSVHGPLVVPPPFLVIVLLEAGPFFVLPSELRDM